MTRIVLDLRSESGEPPAPELDRLETTWLSPPGFFGWWTHVNHTSIGLRFIVTSFIFFLLSGLLALAMRMQLATPLNNLLDPETYYQVMTVHGTAMMFLFAIPAVEGIAIYLVPLMIGARDMAFPRLNAFGYYVYLIGGVVFFGSLFFGVAPDAGWFNYVPLAGAAFSEGYGIDIWTAMITFIEVSALTAAVELAVTILKLRAPGMSIDRMPIFVWSVLVMSLMIIFAMPSVIVASGFLMMDRLVDTQFYIAEGGGAPLLWQHLFWFFGHPEVYIILMPSARHRLDDHRHVHAAADLRLHRAGARARGGRLRELRPVGPPHVRDRPAADGPELLHGRERHDRHSERRPDLLLDRVALGPEDRVRDADALCARLLRDFRARRPHRRHGGLDPLRPAGARHLLRRCPFPLRADRRRRLPDLPGSTTGFRRLPAA